MISSNFYLRPGTILFLLTAAAAGCGDSASNGPSADGSITNTADATDSHIATADAADTHGATVDAADTHIATADAADTHGATADAADSHGATVDAAASSTSVVLGRSGDYAILAKSGISTVPPSAITGDLGVSPAAATAITGFSLIADATNVFSTSSQVTGKVYASDYAVPTPANLTAAIGDMQLAFTDAAGRAAGVTELGSGNIGGMTLPPGVYKWSTGVSIPTDVTLSGGSGGIWIFQVAQNLTMSSAAKVLLTGGALPKNIFWQVAGLVDLGTTAHLEGIVLCEPAVTLRTGASLNGRLLAQTAVNIDTSTIVAPSP